MWQHRFVMREAVLPHNSHFSMNGLQQSWWRIALVVIRPSESFSRARTQANSCFLKGAAHDPVTSTYARRHGDAELVTEDAEELRWAGGAICQALRQAAGSVGPGRDSHVSVEFGEAGCIVQPVQCVPLRVAFFLSGDLEAGISRHRVREEAEEASRDPQSE